MPTSNNAPVNIKATVNTCADSNKAGLPLVPKFIEQFIFNWADKRQTASHSETIISRRQLYILPTRQGITYFLVLILILLGAINYENSLGFMLAFLLGSIGFLNMIYTHQNINQLKLKIGQAEPVFAGQNISFPVHIYNLNGRYNPNLKLLSDTGQVSTAHIIDASETTCNLQLSTAHRGYVFAGRIKLYTEFPLGLFHAWSWLKLDRKCLVYPAPYPHHQPLNYAGDYMHDSGNTHQQGVDDFAGIRQYQDGDSPGQMAWKMIAKTGDLQTKLFSNDTAKKIWIDWAHTNETFDVEHRLSILCRMVLDANDNNIVYGFKLPATTISPSIGLQHKQRCLKALALFGHDKH